ncbi:hypothetical protein [Kribbella sp. NPDC050459]|uniref:hypothetical protein n=1 Tax=Kribbella sp. NPDC050459 TaxID=3155785 RepID=UPI0033C682F8
MFRRRDKESDRVVEVGLDELLWPGASTEEEPDADAADEPAGERVAGDQRISERRAGERGAGERRVGEPAAAPVQPGASFGVAFFGWLVASGTSVLLLALVAAVGTVIGWDELADWSRDWLFVGLWALLVLSLAIGAFSGGYAAARMVPSQGTRQGLEVWLFSWCAAAVLGGLGYFANRQYDLVARVDWPSVPVAEPDRGLAAVIATAAILLVTLVGAVLGGASGNRK